MEKTNQIRPLFDRVLLVAETEQQSQNGIILPRDSSDKSYIMRVVDAGQSGQVKAGQRVIIAKYAGTEVTCGGVVYTLVTEYDILGVFHG